MFLNYEYYLGCLQQNGSSELLKDEYTLTSMKKALLKVHNAIHV